MKIPSLEEMLKSGMHFGHRTSNWHPKMEPYIHSSKKGVYIINLAKTQEKLQSAIEFMENLKKENKTILFIGTKRQAKNKVKETAEALNMPYIVGKWLGGYLTNFQVVKKTIKKYLDLKEKRESGKLEKYTKKEKLNFLREIKKLDHKVGGLVNLNKLPDALFVWDIKEESTAIDEAKNKNIPIIAVCDTNVNPKLVNYPIPANDDATKSIDLILDTIKNNLAK